MTELTLSTPIAFDALLRTVLASCAAAVKHTNTTSSTIALDFLTMVSLPISVDFNTILESCPGNRLVQLSARGPAADQHDGNRRHPGQQYEGHQSERETSGSVP